MESAADRILDRKLQVGAAGLVGPAQLGGDGDVVIDVLHRDRTAGGDVGAVAEAADGRRLGLANGSHGVGDQVMRGAFDHAGHVLIHEVGTVQIDVGDGDDLVHRAQKLGGVTADGDLLAG